MNSAIVQIQARVGISAVLVPIPPNRKGPILVGWQKRTLASMNDPAYLAEFAPGGNIGVLLGEPSQGLCTVDLDGQAEVETFLDLNPAFATTLRTSRVRGENFWFRVVGHYPAACKIKAQPSGNYLGEWRATGNQTVIHGAAMDATKGETQPTAYRFVNNAPPLEIEFDEIHWPESWILPWKPKPSITMPAGSPPGIIVLPSGNLGILDCANTLFPRLAETKRLFVRGGVIVELTPSFGLEIVRASGFRSRIERCGPVMAWRKGKHGQDVLQPTTCPEDMARALLDSEPARDLLPPIATVTGCPVAIEDDGGDLQILGRGYHPELGGILVTSGEEPPQVELAEAVSALSSLLVEFEFQTPSDRARALAAFISPALMIGGFMSGRVPADVAEADQSQAGKGYRQKLIAAIYNENPQVVAQRDGGVGSLDESFSQALIIGRPFVQIDNLRGVLSSPFLEAFFTADFIGARVPHRGEVQVEPRRYFIFASSNGVETTRDFANRASFVRIRKREGHEFHTYPEGGLLEHVKANQAYYLGCVFSVIAEWIASDKPRTKDTRHDFREWAQVLDWIVQKLFGATPLLDGHSAAQERVSNPAMVFLRAICLVVEQEGQIGETFTASNLAELADAHAVVIPGIKPGNEDRAARQIGIHLSRVFKTAQTVDVDGFNVRRDERLESRQDGNGTYPIKTYEITHA